MRNRFLLSLGSMLMCLSGIGCNEVKETEAVFDPNTISEVEFNVDKNRLYGTCDLSFEEWWWRQSNPDTMIDYHQSHTLMANLGATSVRFWSQFSYFMTSPTTYHVGQFRALRDMYLDLVETNPNALVFGMCHTNGLYDETTEKYTFSTAKPKRDLREGSSYRKWLQDYETTWYTLVNLFPEIEYWEIDNEINNDDFMVARDGSLFTLDEKAKISADMLYFASRGIHRANPKAKTISGGIIVFDYSTPEDFLGLLYDEIARNTWGTTKTKDFFQIVGVHPYLEGGASTFTKQRFKDKMNSIYAVIKTREGKDKKVYCTEVGFNDYNGGAGQDKSGTCINSMLEACEELSYVELLAYYKMYDNEKSVNSRYGLFVDPVNRRDGTSSLDSKTDFVAPSLASPKPGAFSFQNKAGGSGDLFSFSHFLRY